MKREKFEEILLEYQFPEDLIHKLWRSIGQMAKDEEMVRRACEECKEAVTIVRLMDSIAVRKSVVNVRFDYSKINYN